MGLSGSMPKPIATSEEIESQLLVKRLAEKNIAVLDRAIAMMMTETVSLYKWILAGLLTLNGGAAAAIISSDRDLSFFTNPLALFTVGAVLALLTALAAAISTLFLSGPAGEVLAYWVDAARTGEFGDHLAPANHKLFKRSLVCHGLSVIVGLLALGCFVAGAISASNTVAIRVTPRATVAASAGPHLLSTARQ